MNIFVDILAIINGFVLVASFIYVMRDAERSLSLIELIQDKINRHILNKWKRKIFLVGSIICLLPAIVIWYILLCIIFIVALIWLLVISPLYNENE